MRDETHQQSLVNTLAGRIRWERESARRTGAMVHPLMMAQAAEDACRQSLQLIAGFCNYDMSCIDELVDLAWKQYQEEKQWTPTNAQESPETAPAT